MRAPILTFLKVNFNGNVTDSIGGVGFVIRGPDSGLVIVHNSHLFGPSIMEAKLRAAWADIIYTRCFLLADCLMIEEKSSTIIT